MIQGAEIISQCAKYIVDILVCKLQTLGMTGFEKLYLSNENHELFLSIDGLSSTLLGVLPWDDEEERRKEGRRRRLGRKPRG